MSSLRIFTMNFSEIEMTMIKEFVNLTEATELQFSDEKEDYYQEFRDTSRFWIQRVLVPLITLIGVVGNTVTIVIMTRKRMRSSTNSYLAALAAFDMLYLIFTFVLSISHYPNANHIDYYFYWLLYPLSVMMCDMASNISVWLTVTFTIERYFVVSYPIKGKMLCTPTRARKIILIISIICSMITIPTIFEWKISETTDEKTNQTYIQIIYSDLGLNLVYRNVYYYLTAILFIFIPLGTLAIFNVFLIRSLHVSNIKRRTLTENPLKRDSDNQTLKPKNSRSESHRQESRITLMLIAVVILFLICQTPTACVLIYTAINEQNNEDVNKQSLIRGLGNIFNFLLAINSGGNFVLYSLLSRKYRQTFVQTFFPNLQKRNILNFTTIRHKTLRTV